MQVPLLLEDETAPTSVPGSSRSSAAPQGRTSEELRANTAQAVPFLPGHPPALPEHLGIATRTSDPRLGRTGAPGPRAGLREAPCRQGRASSDGGSALRAMTKCSGSLRVSPASPFPAFIPRIKLFTSGFQLCFVPVELHWPHTATLIGSNFPSVPLWSSPML